MDFLNLMVTIISRSTEITRRVDLIWKLFKEKMTSEERKEKNLVNEVFWTFTFTKGTGTLYTQKRIGEQSKYWFFTERVPRPSVRKPYINSSFYPEDRRPKTPLRPRLKLFVDSSLCLPD